MTDPTGVTDSVRPAPTAVDPGRSTAPAPGSSADWTDRVTDLIVDSVDKVRARTTGPILDISKASVHAIVAIMLLAPVGVLFLILTIRVLTYFVFREVWITYGVVGMVFVIVGFVLWSRRRPRDVAHY